MKISKSEPKIKFSLKKIENFIPEKNLKEDMYMDTEPQKEKVDLSLKLKSQSSNYLEPKAKLSFSLHDRVNSVLTDSRKMGMLSSTGNPSVNRSAVKISYASTLPPIKTEVQ